MSPAKRKCGRDDTELGYQGKGMDGNLTIYNTWFSVPDESLPSHATVPKNPRLSLGQKSKVRYFAIGTRAKQSKGEDSRVWLGFH